MKGFHSAYYNESHIEFRKAVRKFYADNVVPYVNEWDEQGKLPYDELYRKMGEAGILAAQCPPGPYLKPFKLPNNLKPEEFDYFHELIAH